MAVKPVPSTESSTAAVRRSAQAVVRAVVEAARREWAAVAAESGARQTAAGLAAESAEPQTAAGVAAERRPSALAQSAE